MLNCLKPVLLALILSACSTVQPENKWQHDAATMCKDYQLHFLQNKTVRASSDLLHAKELATRSANFKPLIDIELTQCAMELSVLNPSSCEKVSELLALEPNENQRAYLHLLNAHLQEMEIELLPKQYQDFALLLLKGNTQALNKEISIMQPFSSKLIAAALSKDVIDNENVQELINELSFKGYKKPLLSWLNFQMQKEGNQEEKSRLKAKIKILTFD